MSKRLINLFSAKLQETPLFTTRQPWTDKACYSIHIYGPNYLEFDGDQAWVRAVHNIRECLIQKMLNLSSSPAFRSETPKITSRSSSASMEATIFEAQTKELT